jgi:riboflavin kinase/FMN adenylyltransferase
MCEQKRVIALGFFDGVHLGHGALLRRVTERAKELGAVPCAFTFDAHPSAYLTGEQVPLLNSVQDRVWLMKREYGIQEVIVAPFRKMMTMRWEEFITDYLLHEQHAVHVVAGYDFRFGARGQGDAQRLKAKCARLGMGCDIVGEIELEGIRVSSTYIRTLMEAGDMDRARQFLGHPHVLSGTVQPGKHLGHTLGFPTVNLPFAPGVMVPDYGVYAAKVTLEDGTCCNAVTNIGVRPTVETGAAPNVEAFLLDYQGDLYGQQVRIAFYHRLRGERRFPSVEALTAEVLRNAEQTRAYFQEVG